MQQQIVVVNCPVCCAMLGIALASPLTNSSDDVICPMHGHVKLFAQGGFGFVYLSVLNNVTSVLKLLRVDKGGAGEESCLRSCAHPNVVQHYSSSISADSSHLLIHMEYCDKGDLFREILRRRSTKSFFSESQVLFIFAQLLLSLHHIHGTNVLHRDIKTANILLATPVVPLMVDGQKMPLVKMGDFGLAKLDDSTISEDWERTFCGTFPNLAPEMLTNRQVSGHRTTYSKAAEIWSLGVTMLEIMCLETPFTGEPDVILRNITTRNYKAIPPEACYSSELCHVVEDMMLCLDPTKRASLHQLAQFPQVLHAMEQYVQSCVSWTGNPRLSEPAKQVLARQFSELAEPVPTASGFGTFLRMTRAMRLAPYILSLDDKKLYLTDVGSGDVKRLDLGCLVGFREDNDHWEEEEELEDSVTGDEENSKKYPFGVELNYRSSGGKTSTMLLYSASRAARDELLSGVSARVKAMN